MEEEILQKSIFILVIVFLLGINIPYIYSETTSVNNRESAVSLIIDSTKYMHCCPVMGKVISPFGKRGGRKHTGADVKLQKGDTVRAALSGVVTKASSYFGYGNLVIIKHPEKYETYYSHLSKCLVEPGDSVYAGYPVGLGGRTGRATTNHLHFEVRKNGTPQNPEKYFNFSCSEIKKPIIASPAELFFRTDIFSKKEEKTKQSQNSDAETAKESFDENITEITVVKGDTLYALARQHGTSIQQLKELNNLKSSSLKIGMKLKVR